MCNNEVDQNWNEFIKVEETKKEVTENQNLEDFLLLVNKTKLSG